MRIDWEHIGHAGVKYGDAPDKRDTCTGHYPATDKNGCPRTDAEYLHNIQPGAWAVDPEGRRFQILGAGSVQGSVILLNEAGVQFHAASDTRLRPE